jgi:hypothetical protein
VRRARTGPLKAAYRRTRRGFTKILKSPTQGWPSMTVGPKTKAQANLLGLANRARLPVLRYTT